jgi:hypothetical protein
MIHMNAADCADQNFAHNLIGLQLPTHCKLDQIHKHNNGNGKQQQVWDKKPKNVRRELPAIGVHNVSHFIFVFLHFQHRRAWD